MFQFLNIVTFKIKGITVLTFLFQTIINEQLLILIYLFVLLLRKNINESIFEKNCICILKRSTDVMKCLKMADIDLN